MVLQRRLERQMEQKLNAARNVAAAGQPLAALAVEDDGVEGEEDVQDEAEGQPHLEVPPPPVRLHLEGHAQRHEHGGVANAEEDDRVPPALPRAVGKDEAFRLDLLGRRLETPAAAARAAAGRARVRGARRYAEADDSSESTCLRKGARVGV